MAGKRARRADKDPPTDHDPSGERRTCTRRYCDQPAAYDDADAAEAYCEPCANYVAGRHENMATRASDKLAAAIADLRASGLTPTHIKAVVDTDLQGKVRPIDLGVPDSDHPRPWVAHLFERIE